MSDLPPNPPMRSTPRTKPASRSVFARSTSSAVGPSFSSRASSSLTAFSTAARSPPGRAVARITNVLPISLVPW